MSNLYNFDCTIVTGQTLISPALYLYQTSHPMNNNKDRLFVLINLFPYLFLFRHS